MTKQKVVTIIGARPQFIKASAVSGAFKRLGTRLSEVVVHTGQHYDANMSEIFFEELNLPRPDYNLCIGGGSHGQNTGRMIEAIEAVLIKERPDIVLVYGDTDSTLAGAVAASKLHMPIAHVEAGLRSFNQRMPEEINRVLTDHVSRWLLAPTKMAEANLRREGLAADRITVTGDVMYDVALRFGDMSEKQSRILEQLGITDSQYALLTLHRAENTENEKHFSCVMEAMLQLSQTTTVVWPVHPRTRARFSGHIAALAQKPGFRILEPVGYLDMVRLEAAASLIVTDSGGVQKEAYFHAVPCVTLREETEWVELVEAGWNRLASPSDTQAIIEMCSTAMRTKPQSGGNLYGDGRAADKVVRTLHEALDHSSTQ